MMLTQQAIAETSADGVVHADTLEALSVIGRKDCAAAIWNRRLSPDVQTWINTLDPEQLPKARVVRRPSAIRDTLFEICEASATPGCASRESFIQDSADLATMFADLVAAPYLRLRFDVITNNACRKFHIDTVTARLICTYRGTGTQYGTALSGDDPQHIFTVPTGAPILLRGRLWQEEPDTRLRHRSPPIEGTGETRLVLVLDPMAGPEDD